jgi:hypothetical protein
MAEFIVLLVFRVLLSLILWLVLIPVGYVLAAPIIFFMVLFRYEGTFWDNVWEEYRHLWRFWKHIGILMMP